MVPCLAALWGFSMQRQVRNRSVWASLHWLGPLVFTFLVLLISSPLFAVEFSDSLEQTGQQLWHQVLCFLDGFVGCVCLERVQS